MFLCVFRGVGRTGLTVLLMLLVVSSCAGRVRARDFLLPVDPQTSGDPDAEPKLLPRWSVHPRTGETSARWTVLSWPDGRVEKHGVEERFFPDGSIRARHSFDRGQPSGEWRSWYASGVLRSEYDYGGPGEATSLRFYHPDGRPSAEGLACRGVRRGAWAFWYADGSLRQAGSYREGRREGVWTLRWQGGGLRSRGHFVDDERVGEWKHWAESPAVAESAWTPPAPGQTP